MHFTNFTPQAMGALRQSLDEAAHLRPEFVGELATSVRALRGRFAHDHKEMANEIRATSEAFRGRPTARRTDT